MQSIFEREDSLVVAVDQINEHHHRPEIETCQNPVCTFVCQWDGALGVPALHLHTATANRASNRPPFDSQKCQAPSMREVPLGDD